MTQMPELHNTHEEDESLLPQLREPLKYTIFLIEDDDIDKNDIIRVLQRSPYVHNVHWFRSGDELLEHFTVSGFYADSTLRRIPSMILLDLHIPGIDGMSLLQRLKENPATADIPVVIVSGDTSAEATAGAMRLRANAYVSKPLKLAQIHEVMTTGWGWPIYDTGKLPQA